MTKSEVIERHGELLVNYCRRLDRNEWEDLVQSTYLRFYSRGVTDYSNVGGYLCAIARNLFIDKKTRDKKKRTLGLDTLGVQVNPPRCFSHMDHDKDLIENLIIDTLKPKESLAVMMFAENYSSKEISEIMDINENTVRTLIRVGRIKIVKKLNNNYEEITANFAARNKHAIDGPKPHPANI